MTERQHPQTGPETVTPEAEQLDALENGELRATVNEYLHNHPYSAEATRKALEYVQEETLLVPDDNQLKQALMRHIKGEPEPVNTGLDDWRQQLEQQDNPPAPLPNPDASPVNGLDDWRRQVEEDEGAGTTNQPASPNPDETKSNEPTGESKKWTPKVLLGRAQSMYDRIFTVHKDELATHIDFDDPDLSKHQQLVRTRAELVAMRAYERRTIFAKVDKEELSELEAAYVNEINKTIINEVAEAALKALNSGEAFTKEDQSRLITQRLAYEMAQRSTLEQEAREKQLGAGAKFVRWWQQNKKIRIGAGVAMGVGGGVLLASGLGVAAAGVFALRAGGAYLSGKAGAEAMVDRRAKKGKGLLDSAEKQGIYLDKDEVSDDPDLQKIANTLGHFTDRPDTELSDEDKALISVLSEAGSSQLNQNIESEGNLTDGLSKTLLGQMEAESARLKSDKRVNRIGVVIASAAALAAGATRIVDALTPDAPVHEAQHVSLGGSHVEQPDYPGAGLADKRLTLTYDPDHSYPDVIKDYDSGSLDSKATVLSKHLENIKEFKSLSPADQAQVKQELLPKLEFRTNEDVPYWRLEKADITNSIYKYK
ncbi:hypothetical protein EPO04_02070 [Patescibacteria group bacterium]|nr:MAG: hypothetical protein EPO04_02070 [Patescibacteria group bacterium]